MAETRKMPEGAEHPVSGQSSRPAAEETVRMREEADPFFWPWLRFWAQMAVLAVLMIVGVFFASEGGQAGDYQSGLMLAAASVALAVLLAKQHLDGAPDDLASLVLVEDMRSLAVAIPLFTIAALCGLIIARSFPVGPRYLFGLGLFGASVLAILLDIKHVFDRIDRGEH
jgi:hypothetical protein